MANPDHLQVLKQGAAKWNSWRGKNRNIRPDLTNVDLTGAVLINTNLVLAHINSATLIGANLNGANARGADFTGANLQRAHCNGTDLHGANLQDANLSDVDFGGANLSQTQLDGADFKRAHLYETIIGNTNLSRVKNLDACNHLAPCILDYRTLAKSGNLPLVFLRGCGLPDALIEYLPSLLNATLSFYSCFISYSSKDQDFTDRLYSDLQSKGVRCWFAPKTSKLETGFVIGLTHQSDRATTYSLILSENSIASDWVEHEVESALEEERQRSQTILFPIRLDNAVLESDKAWAALIRRTRHIGDFTRWEDHDSYKRAFERLLHDLKAENGS